MHGPAERRRRRLAAGLPPAGADWATRRRARVRAGIGWTLWGRSLSPSVGGAAAWPEAEVLCRCHHGGPGDGGRGRLRRLHGARDGVAAGEVRQPGRAGAAERVAGAQHPLRAHPAWGEIPAHHGRGDGRGHEGQRLPAAAADPAPGQRPADGGDAARGRGGTVWGHAAPGCPLPHLHPAEQPAVRGHLQPACCHLPGDLPAEDPDHGAVLGAAAGHGAVAAAVAVAGAALRGGGAGAGGAGSGSANPGGAGTVGGPRGAPSELRRGAGGRGCLLPVLGLRRRLLRAAAEALGRLHLAAQRSAGRRGHGRGAGRHAGRRGPGRGRARLLLRLQRRRLGRGGQPGGRGAAGGRGGSLRRQHPQGVRHGALHPGLHGRLGASVRVPAAGALPGRHRHGARRRRALRAAPRQPGRPRPRAGRRQVSQQGQGHLTAPSHPGPYRGYRGTIGSIWTLSRGPVPPPGPLSPYSCHMAAPLPGAIGTLPSPYRRHMDPPQTL